MLILPALQGLEFCYLFYNVGTKTGGAEVSLKPKI